MATGDKKPIVMGEPIGTEGGPAPNTHASRHAKDGADPLTLDMIGAAPAGYGLGNATLVRCTFDEIDTIVGNGLWWVSGGSQLVISGHTIGASLLKQTGEFGSLRTQTLHLFGATTSYAYNTQLLRSMKSAGWGVWEWVNPPMVLGVEYRTTERYNGKPVYVKLVDFGALPNVTIKSVTWGDSTTRAHQVVGRTIIGEQAYTLPIMNEVTIWVNGSAVSVNTTKDYSNWPAYALIQYTKTTD